jgi:hypothetical protein
MCPNIMLSPFLFGKGWDEAIFYCALVILVEIVDLLAIGGNATN